MARSKVMSMADHFDVVVGTGYDAGRLGRLGRLHPELSLEYMERLFEIGDNLSFTWIGNIGMDLPQHALAAIDILKRSRKAAASENIGRIAGKHVHLMEHALDALCEQGTSDAAHQTRELADKHPQFILYAFAKLKVMDNVSAPFEIQMLSTKHKQYAGQGIDALVFMGTRDVISNIRSIAKCCPEHAEKAQAAISEIERKYPDTSFDGGTRLQPFFG